MLFKKSRGLPRGKPALPAKTGLFATAVAVLAEFGENPLGELGVQERYFLGVGADFGLLVYEADPLGLGVGEVGDDIVGVESDVVNSAVGVLFQKLGYWAVGRSGLEQLDVNPADGEESRLDFLVGDFLDALALESENVFVIGNRIVNLFNGDAEMVKFLQHNNNLFFKKLRRLPHLRQILSTLL